MNRDAVVTDPPTSAEAKAEHSSLPQQIDSLSQQVQGLIGDAQPLESTDERRTRDRFPIPYMFRLVPMSDDGELRIDETTTVVGKDISLSGVAFSHDHDLRCRRALISLDHPMVGRFAVEAEIVWTRPTPIGLFESGCRLVRTVDGHTLCPKN